MTRAERQAFRMLEEAAADVLAAVRPIPYTTGERALKRLDDALGTLERVRKADEPGENLTGHGSDGAGQ